MVFQPTQVAVLLLLAVVVACVAWTVTHEEIFREIREAAKQLSEHGPWFLRKFFYVFTCEYCFSHYVTLAILALTNFKLLLNDWRGYVLAFFAIVWISNQYMGIYDRLRLTIKSERVEVETQEEVRDKMKTGRG